MSRWELVNGVPTEIKTSVDEALASAIKEYRSADLLFGVDPEKPKGTARTWRMLEESGDRPPTIGTIYVPKWLRSHRGRPAIPCEMRLSFQIRYVQVDPGLFFKKKDED